MTTVSNVLGQIGEVLRETTCQHCGQSPFSTEDIAAAVQQERRWRWDEIDEDEQRMWAAYNRMAELEEQMPAHPVGAAPLDELRQQFNDAQERYQRCENALEEHRAQSTGIRPSTRDKQARKDRRLVSEFMAAQQRYRQTRGDLDAAERIERQREAFIDKRHAEIEGGRRVSAELDARVDTILDDYLASPASAPAWIRTFGLPGTADGPTWMSNARDLVRYRRRNGIVDPHLVLPPACVGDSRVQMAANWFDRRRRD